MQSNYVGASARIVESAVTTPIEQQVNGAEGMRYISSTSGNDGTSVITVTFDVDRDKDLAAVDVQNRVNTALPRLPTEVKNTGVTITKTTAAIVMGVGFFSDDGSLSNTFISNYLDSTCATRIRRLPGVAEVRIFGERRYAMRLWLDPVRLAARGLTATEVVSALREQNANIAAGQVGQPPAHAGADVSDQRERRRPPQRSAPVRAAGHQARRPGRRARWCCWATSAAPSSAPRTTPSTCASTGATRSASGSSSCPTPTRWSWRRRSARSCEKLAAAFPPSMKYKIAFNPTDAVRASIGEVMKTLFEAIILVILVIFLFLQDWRATVIPAVTIPVSLVGHVRLHQGLRVLDQHADAVRDRAGDRAWSSTTPSSWSRTSRAT